MDVFKLLEYLGTAAGLGYLFFIVAESMWCWIFGILGSLITVFLYFHTKLYLESILNIYYVLAAFYGWWYWKTRARKNEGEGKVPVVKWTIPKHLINITSCVVLSLITGFLMKKYTDSPRPYIDTTLAIFSFSATFLEARKVLSAWIYWLIINGITIGLQYDRGLNIYATLSIVYTVMSIVGYFRWKKSYDNQHFDGILLQKES